MVAIVRARKTAPPTVPPAMAPTLEVGEGVGPLRDVSRVGPGASREI